ncbi:hypothetical protein MMC18_007203 [Xylographa bjoerkii]|nr:hypothetical protein [Xylographa bjoerkii]
MPETIRILFGTHPISEWSKETQEEFLAVLQEHHVKDIDTACNYPGSEKALGDLGAPKNFIIHTKAPGFSPGCLSKDKVLAASKKSLEELGTNSVETYFLHSPDSETPIEETTEAMQELYAAGKYKYFGLSNFPAAEVQKIYDYCKSKDYVLPTVYQGNYNPVARHTEADLFPLLRKLGIRFYAYSPLAGGFLVRSPEAIEKADEGRFDKTTRVGEMYHKLYNRPALIKALTEWEAISKEAGVSKAALAYRWVTFNSILKPEYEDGIILGGSRPAQLEETLKALQEGPLKPEIAEKIDLVWEAVKHEAPIDNFKF